MDSGRVLLVLGLVVFAFGWVASSAPALTEGRVYEMVSPPYKGGYGVFPAGAILAVEPGGERVAFFTFGAISDPPGGPNLPGYLARRGGSGWSSVPLIPPAAIAPATIHGDFSPSLESSLTFNVTGPSDLAAVYNKDPSNEFLLHNTETPDTTENFEVAGGIVLTPVDKERGETNFYFGASPDLCHMLFGENHHLLPTALEERVPRLELYELDRGCGGSESALRLVGLKNDGKLMNPVCDVESGLFFGGHGLASNNQFNAIAAGGSEIFFTGRVESGEKPDCYKTPYQLFLRLGGARTIEVSRPVSPVCSKEEVPCAGAVSRASSNFAGADEAGTEAFFTTTEKLTGGDTDGRADLYMARIGCPGVEPLGGGAGVCEAAQKQVTSLVQVSHDPTAGQAGDLQGVVRVSPDGSHVYFVARGVLSEGANAQGALPVSGADNLYAYETASGKRTFIDELCSGPGASGEAEDPYCPLDLRVGSSGARNDTTLWEGGGESQTSGKDGRFLLFSSYAQLLPSDTDTAKDVYRYDAEIGTLDRVSLGEVGSDTNGNNDTFDAKISPGNVTGRVTDLQQLTTRAISDDGSRIVFTTAEPLSAAAVNHLVNVYEWHKQADLSEGEVSLISSGSSEESDREVVISASGRDVFFTTVQGLLAQDTDGEADIYDARLGGGFPPPPALRQPCSGDACQGPLTNPAPLLVPGSVSQAPGENFTAAGKMVRVPKAKKRKAPTKKNKKKGKAKRAVRARHSGMGTSRGKVG
jgi:hypothetical protein